MYVNEYVGDECRGFLAIGLLVNILVYDFGIHIMIKSNCYPVWEYRQKVNSI